MDKVFFFCFFFVSPGVVLSNYSFGEIVKSRTL